MKLKKNDVLVDIKSNKVLNFIDYFNSKSIEYQSNLNNDFKKSSGVYYTSLEYSYYMVNNLMSKRRITKPIYSFKFLEPCVGLGSFVFAYLIYIFEHYKLNKNQWIELIENINVCESDKFALEEFLNLLNYYCQNILSISLPTEFKQNNTGEHLIYDLNSFTEKKIISDIFGRKKFDIIITNPPYKLLKAESKHYNNIEKYNADKAVYNKIKNDVKKSFSLQGPGSLNLYKLFVEDIITNYASNTALVYLLIPQTFLTDLNSKFLRKKILNDFQILHITNTDENTNITFAKQSLTAILFTNIISSKDQSFEMINYFDTFKENHIEIKALPLLENPDYKIIGHSQSEVKFINKFNTFPKLKDLDFIINHRGELDLTLNKNSYSKVKTNFKLIRGKNISSYFLNDNTDFFEYVSPDFISKTKKSQFINKERIASPQIANKNLRKRLKFSYIKKNFVLANSCNYIHVFPNKYEINLFYLLGLFNSKYFDDYFKLFSSNNHINNHDLDNLPIPTNIIFIKKISTLSKMYLKNKNNQHLNCIDEEISKLITLGNNKYSYVSEIQYCFPKITSNFAIDIYNNKELLKSKTIKNQYCPLELKIIDGLIDKYRLTESDSLLNNYFYKLSDLDLEMIENIPEGGNWQNIPDSVVKKSKRLQNIKKNGGRTTLYGRLSYNKPSFTITTYFNRPGNGTNVHPKFDRVLTSREAARLQSFPDDYFFFGTKTSLLKQIGNAVPPLVSYQIALSIKEKISIETSLDLFNGAGGLMYGFKLAGVQSKLLNDIDLNSLITAKLNNLSANILYGDITDIDIKQKIIKSGQDIDIILGGPPCQGFSLAGYRNVEDKRNELIYDYVQVIKKTKPKVFVFENVPGLISYNHGKTYNELLSLFSECGYHTSMKLLDFSDYGVPQKRKRVIIIGVLKSLNINPIQLFPKEITPSLNDKITTFDAISDLENSNNVGTENYKNNTLYNKYMTNQISIDDYISSITSSLNEQLRFF